jgi:hypothetical protein
MPTLHTLQGDQLVTTVPPPTTLAPSPPHFLGNRMVVLTYSTLNCQRGTLSDCMPDHSSSAGHYITLLSDVWPEAPCACRKEKNSQLPKT